MFSKAIKILTEAETTYYLIYPEYEKIDSTYPFSGNASHSTVQPRIYFDEYTIAGRKAFQGLLQNIMPESKWTDKTVMNWVCEASEYGWREVINETLYDSRVMIGTGYDKPDGGVVITDILSDDTLRPVDSVSIIAEPVRFPWRTKDGLEWHNCMAIKTQNPIVFTPNFSWTRFYDGGVFTHDSVYKLKELPNFYFQLKSRDRISDLEYANCYSAEIINLLLTTIPVPPPA